MLGPNREIVLKSLRCPALIVAAWMLTAGLLAAPPPQLRFVVIITRHGVRSPTGDNARLNPYSAEPWPQWSVPPGILTPHGRALMQLMGTYYHEWLTSEHLLRAAGCEDASRVYIHADTDQRTFETGRALADTLLPGCTLIVHSASEGSKDPLFDPIAAGVGKPEPEVAAKAVRERVDNPKQFADSHRAAFEALESVLAGGGSPQNPIAPPAEITATATAKSVQLNEPWGLASTFSENLLLEYTDGMQGKELGWGRLDSSNLIRILELHEAVSDLTRRTPYLARARGSNLLDHVLLSMEQAATGKAVPGALGPVDDSVLIVSGHDTNLSNLSGMLGLSWHLQGYPADETPPGGALIFSLWQKSGHFFVRTQYLAQTLDQMRNAIPLSLSAPPEKEDLAVAGCEAATKHAGCSWETFQKSLQAAIDNQFVAM